MSTCSCMPVYSFSSCVHLTVIASRSRCNALMSFWLTCSCAAEASTCRVPVCSPVAVELLPWASSLDEVCNSVSFTTWLVIPVIASLSFTCSLNSTCSLVMSQVSVYTKCLEEHDCYARFFRSCDCLGFTFCRNQFLVLGYLEKICTWTTVRSGRRSFWAACMHASIDSLWQSNTRQSFFLSCSVNPGCAWNQSPSTLQQKDFPPEAHECIATKIFHVPWSWHCIRCKA